MQANDIAIVGAVRTAIGSFTGILRDISAVELGSTVIREALRRSGLASAEVDEVIMGNVLQAGLGQNPARQAALAAGIPQEASAVTVNQVCGSGLKAIQLACQAIATGQNEIIVAGGMENMSQAPYLLTGARSGYRMGHRSMIDSMIHDGLWCAIGDYHMGITAENLCEAYSLTRLQLDEYAYHSQRKALAAIREERFKEEIVPIAVPQRRGDPLLFDTDESPRSDTTSEGLARLKPAFREQGLVTAGNSSGINDGAAAVVVMSASRARERGIEPLALIRANATAGVDPSLMGIGPVPATERVLSMSGLSTRDIALIEANEAFAAQSLAYASHFDFDPEAINVNGGAIALGHPIGASGARILVTLLHEMKRRGVRFGLGALCIGGGQGIATIIENGEVSRS